MITAIKNIAKASSSHRWAITHIFNYLRREMVFEYDEDVLFEMAVIYTDRFYGGN